MKNLVFLTGAGISAESGLSTFRDADGLWEQYPVMQVASHEGYVQNPKLVHAFYNMLRHKIKEQKVEPNAAHRIIASLQDKFNVTVVTQNVDDLHERAGCTQVLHLHGELMKVRSTKHEERLYQLPCSDLVTPPESITPLNYEGLGYLPKPDDYDASLDTTPSTRDPYGDPVRPHIVFFNEDVPNITPAIDIVRSADIVVIIGTSLVVYPAASLMRFARPGVPVYYIDPRPAQVPGNIKVIAKGAGDGMTELAPTLLAQQ